MPGRQVVFDTPPEPGARILISVDTIAEYQVAGNQIQIVGTVNLNDRIQVITWNDTAQQNILTQVFRGPVVSGITINEPYDSTDFDIGLVNDAPGSFDYTVGSVISNNNFVLDRQDVDASRLWVTLNGFRLFEGVDFTVSGNQIMLSSGTIQTNDTLAVTQFTNSIVPDAIAFRIFQDMRGVQTTYRITESTTTELTASLSATADVITVLDAGALSEPNLAIGQFGVITIDGERILYRQRNLDNNTVSGLRRGTAGTGAADHEVGAAVYDLGSGNMLFDEYQNYVVKDTSIADGSTLIFDAPSIDIDNSGDSSTVSSQSIEVYVGGIRQYAYNETQAESQYRWVIGTYSPVSVEFIEDTAVDPPLTAPAAGLEVTILVRRGKSWYQPGIATASDGAALQETNTLAARFLRGL